MPFAKLLFYTQQRKSTMINYYSQNTKIGEITIFEENNYIIKVCIGSNFVSTVGCHKVKTPVISEALEQLTGYLDRQREEFYLPLKPKGTAFQQKVWAELLKIPYGQTSSYKEVAEKIGNPKACRAIGMANNKNPIPIFIPCHRVIGKNGSLTGYAGGLELKNTLLNIEKFNP